MSRDNIQPVAQAPTPLPRDLPFRRNPALEIHRIKWSLLLVDPATGATRLLDPLAAGVWYLLKDPTTLAEAITTLRQMVPDQDQARVNAEIEQLFRELQAENMILPEHRKAG
ncbi:PqqD family protein [Thioalkalivibrio thiocyanodenitrificans]|uniref:PqqD family protein n=1 Tax=Thioalkalivibrio thiocyanodenitrificans TaxID=243063 RepID=UPI000360A3E7|nr:PqqD family protein [Thioalkalivibrio thiocyanodenitrificans]